MLAARLCFAWGIEDVEAWMDSVPARVLDFWQAFDSLEPIGEHWKQTAETNALLARLVEFQAAKLGAELETTTVEDCMPERYRRKKRSQKVDDSAKNAVPNQFQQVAAALGFTEIVKKHGKRINQSG